MTAKPQITRTPRRQHFESAPDLPMRIRPRSCTRHRTVFALGSVALVAALGVLLVYVNRVPTGAIGADDSMFTRATEDDSADGRCHPNLPPAIARVLAEAQPG